MPKGTIRCNVNSQATIFTAELSAIQEALSHVENEDAYIYRIILVIYSYSKSALQTLERSIVNEIMNATDRIQMQKMWIKFCWVSAHIGVTSN